MARPRTVSPPDNELEKLGEDMLTWLVEHPQTLHLSEYWCLHKGFLENVWETIINKPIFIPYYEQALRFIGRKYLDKDSNVREGVSQRWQRTYFKDLRKNEDQDAREELERKKELEDHKAKANKEMLSNISQEAKASISGIMQMLDAARFIHGDSSSENNDFNKKSKLK